MASPVQVSDSIVDALKIAAAVAGGGGIAKILGWVRSPESNRLKFEEQLMVQYRDLVGKLAESDKNCAERLEESEEKCQVRMDRIVAAHNRDIDKVRNDLDKMSGQWSQALMDRQNLHTTVMSMVNQMHEMRSELDATVSRDHSSSDQA